MTATTAHTIRSAGLAASLAAGQRPRPAGNSLQQHHPALTLDVGDHSGATA